jgi:hypothetical protein
MNGSDLIGYVNKLSDSSVALIDMCPIIIDGTHFNFKILLFKQIK